MREFWHMRVNFLWSISARHVAEKRACAVALIFVLSLVLSVPAGAATPPASGPTFKHLDGHWRTSEGEVVVLSDVGAVDIDVFKGGEGPLHEGGLLTSTIDSGGECPGARTKYITVTVQGGKLIGTMQRCAHPTLVAPPCNKPSAWETPVRLTVQSSDFISGYYHSEWFNGDRDAEKKATALTPATPAAIRKSHST